ncbi:MAG TPA: cation diffusion facilitator family transporter [Bacteroidota bacterium]|nr:cation diffusion facilitator family transporter [Bacteroidota bacterium]
MSEEHSHTPAPGKHLLVAIALNALIFVVELAGGILTNSLALISDSLHNLSDFLALILSYIATRVVRWKSNPEKSYGYVRVEIFVAFINATTLVVIGMYVCYEGILRFAHPEPVLGEWMLAIAVIGFVVNAAATLLLKTHAHHDLNLKSAYLHLLTDAIESLAVVVVAGIIAWKDWRILDPLVSIGIGLFIIKSAWGIVAETVHILTEGTPRGINLDEVAAFIQSFPGVENVHHLHIWGLSTRMRALSAHIVVQDQLISTGNKISSQLEHELEHRFGINHPTFQLESCVCGDQGVVVEFHPTHKA